MGGVLAGGAPTAVDGDSISGTIKLVLAVEADTIGSGLGSAGGISAPGRSKSLKEPAGIAGSFLFVLFWFPSKISAIEKANENARLYSRLTHIYKNVNPDSLLYFKT